MLAGLDAALARYDWLDPDQVAVEGGSYGGQLTNWLITQTTRFKAAIPSASISNLISLSYTIWAADYPRVEFNGYPWENGNAAKMWERSALAHIAKVKTPTMLIHGELDQDVVVTEAEQMFNALEAGGCRSRVPALPARRPQPARAAARVDAMERSVAWYERHLPQRAGTAQRHSLRSLGSEALAPLVPCRILPGIAEGVSSSIRIGGFMGIRSRSRSCMVVVAALLARSTTRRLPRAAPGTSRARSATSRAAPCPAWP